MWTREACRQTPLCCGCSTLLLNKPLTTIKQTLQVNENRSPSAMFAPYQYLCRLNICAATTRELRHAATTRGLTWASWMKTVIIKREADRFNSPVVQLRISERINQDVTPMYSGESSAYIDIAGWSWIRKSINPHRGMCSPNMETVSIRVAETK